MTNNQYQKIIRLIIDYSNCPKGSSWQKQTMNEIKTELKKELDKTIEDNTLDKLS